ncbi:hypothetical protein MTYM_01034 [Methylococcales bacterium]|nr:hypothetical protein MTYM_01034 [Methylococcales bacterium]
MSKGHRDNHQARLKRGSIAFKKKAERRAKPKKFKCNLCGTPSRKLEGGICPRCIERATG